MAEIEASLLAKVRSAASSYDRPVLIGFLRGRKKRVGTLIEAVSNQSLKELKREIKKKGGKKLKVYKEISTIYAEMPVDKVQDLASVSCAQKVYDAEGDVKLSLYESVPLVMGVEKWQLPYRVKGHKLEGQGVKVAVIDSGIDKSHPDFGLFGWRVQASKNFSGGRASKGREHGTHVAGIIAGSGKASGYRYVGVAPKATLYDAKVFMNAETPTTRDTIIEATLWAVKKNVDVINMSFGDNHSCTDGTCPLCKTADYAVSQGITVVAAAGNVGPAEGTISCPGNAKDVITVGATTKTEPVVVTGYSSRGSTRQFDKPDLVAPGEKITAPQPGKSYTTMTGTSMAAPHVSGMAALLYETEKHINSKKRITPAKIKERLKQGSIDLGEHPSAQGSGLINFEKELAAIQQAQKPRRFLNKKRTLKKTIDQQEESHSTAATTYKEEIPKICPVSISMYCPHYDQRACQMSYQTCVHYQAAAQAKVLGEINHQAGITTSKLSLTQLLPQKKPLFLLPYRGTTTVSGRLKGTITGKPLSGISVKIGNQFTMTDYYGKFQLSGVPKGIVAIELQGDNIYPRRVLVKSHQIGAIQIDAIEKNSNFNLRFYQELARGAWERYNNPIYRWTRRKPPNFYLDTNSSSIHGKVTASTIRKMKNVIKRIVPVFSGKFYRKMDVSIKVKEFAHGNFDFVPENSIVISFDDSLAQRGLLGITWTSPFFLVPGQPGSLHKVRIYMVHDERYYKRSGISREEVLAHELGHGFGFRHTSILPSVMNQSKSCGAFFTEHDKLHMKIIYKRPVGNTHIDNDLIPNTQSMLSSFPQEEVFIDSWGDFSLSEKEKRHLEALPKLNQNLFEPKPL